MKKTRKALLSSVISLVLCFSMLLGTTYAWFTDSETSTNNIIKSGVLDLEMYWTDDLENGVWKDASEGSIFNYEYWEPGYTDVKYIKIANEGNLAFRYALEIVPDGAVTKLADVIDVYLMENPTVNLTGRGDLSGYVAPLISVINGTTTGSGTLLPKSDSNPGEIVLAIAMKMQETAGNEYQTMSLSANADGMQTSFAVRLMATQYTYEADSFDDTYDTDAEWPGMGLPGGDVETSVPVAVENGVTTADASMTSGEVSATVPAGVSVNDGVSKLTLSVTEKENTDSNITTGTNEELVALDVHIDGISENNTKPIIVALGKVLPVGLNMGNLSLYHVENGNTNRMEQVDSVEALTAHNQFYYDPATGNLTVAMATFSEVALIADTVNAWNGTVATDFAGGSGTEADPYLIANADQLAYLNECISTKNDTYGSAYYKLIADVNLGGEDNANKNILFYPIGYHAVGGEIKTVDLHDLPEFLYFNDNYDDSDYAASRSGAAAIDEDGNTTWYTFGGSFSGTFDGDGHTISNIYQNTWQLKGNYDGNYWNAAMGLFGYVNRGTVKNLTVDNFSSDGEFTPTGVIAAYAANSTFENIAITNCNPRVYNTGNGGIVGIGGNSDDPEAYKLTFTNITIDNTNKISALWGSWDVACGGLVGMFRGAGHVYMTNCHVAAQIDVYNDVCGNYQYYWYRYAGMMVGTNKNMTTDANGYTVPETSKFHAENCTVHFGEWNDYYYCELVANSLASYTHDHQFSRLTEVKAVNGTTVTYLDGTTGTVPTSGKYNYVVVKGEASTENATCYHFVNGAIWNHADAGEETVNGTTVLKEDKQHVYLPFNQLFTGYGWGVKHIPVYNGEDYAFEGITILDREVADSVEKFETKFTGDFLYRVGNQNTVSLGSLFKAKDGAEINSSGVWVTVEKVDENMNVSGTFTANTSDWTKGTIQFSGTGVVKVTIQDYNFCTPTVLTLEVVDAVNATGATSATSNNVVLLNDIGSGFTVSGEYTVFGNGFTLNYTGDGQYLNNGLRQGVVNVSENGRLDNLKIKASIYPASYLYYEEVKKGPSSVEGDKTRYHYQLSAVVAKDNATISNCYIYGGRNNIFVDTGNVTITETITECGTLANIQIQSTNASTVTLNNVTTIQHRVNATIGDTAQIMMGAGIIVGPDTETNPTIVLNGDFKQYNWVTSEDKVAITNNTAQTIIQTALDATAFNHTVNGKTASNLGIIYLNSADATVTNNTGLLYEFGNVEMLNQNGKVYSLQNATESQIYSDVENADRSTVNGDYLPTFVFDLGNQEISYDGSEDTRYLYGDKNGVNALYKDGEDTLTLDLTKLATIYKYKGITYAVTVVCKNSSGNALEQNNGVVTLDAQGDYTIVFTVNDNIFYDKNGQTIVKSVTREYTVPLKLTVKAADTKNATVNITKTALDGVYTTVNLTDYKLRINFLDCISVTDYDNKGTGTTVDLTSNISSATLTPSGVNVFTTASTVTVTYTDGRVLTVNLSKISGSSAGTKTATVNTSGGLYFITDGALNNKPTEAASQNTCTITSVSYKGNSGSMVTNDTDVTVTWALGSSGGTSPCVTKDTLVTLADGTAKRIDEITYDDNLLVWNFFEGKYDMASAAIIFDHGADNNTVIELTFSDGTTVKVVNMHQFYDSDMNRFITITKDTVVDYVGHRFAKRDGDGNVFVELVAYSVTDAYVEAWGVMTAEHYNIIVADMLSADFDLKDVELFNYFRIGEDMKFDEKQMQADTEKYGLYTYDDFADYLTREQFDAFNVQYFKIPVGKGVYTYEGILELIDVYLNN